MWEERVQWQMFATRGRYLTQTFLPQLWTAALRVAWVLTWLWMYLVCRPWSSSPFPSTSSLYLGLMTTMMSTDFCKMTSHCQLLQKTTDCKSIHSLCSDSIVRLTSFRYLSIHLVMPILWIGSSKMSICQETGRVWVFVRKATESQRWWSLTGGSTYCWFEPLSSQKFDERNHFFGRVHRICDENIPCQRKVSEASLSVPITVFKIRKRTLYAGTSTWLTTLLR